MWIAEAAWLDQSLRDKLRHTSVNALFMSGALPVQAFMMPLCLGLAAWVSRYHMGIVSLLPDAGSPWIKYGAMFFALDALDYVYHSVMHRIPFFWRLHRVHHSDPALDVSTTFREHPGETLVRNCFLMAWILCTGASAEVLLLRQSVETAANILAHSAVRIPPGAAKMLGWCFITPNLHHVHHHFQRPATNSNFGDVFSFWDRLFGTYMHLEAQEIVFGLDTDEAQFQNTDEPALAERMGSSFQ